MKTPALIAYRIVIILPCIALLAVSFPFFVGYALLTESFERDHLATAMRIFGRVMLYKDPMP